MAAIADGLNIKQACMAVGIGETILHSWREEHPELEQQLEEARERCRGKPWPGSRQQAKRATGERWKHSCECHLLPINRRDGSINVNAAATVQQAGLVCDEATRMRLIALREKLTLAERGAKQLEASPPGVSVFSSNYGTTVSVRSLPSPPS